MGGGGGTVTSSNLPPIVKKSWEVGLAGADVVETTYIDWPSWFEYTSATTPTTFVANPSIVRWIQERALTDRGGNPFEGVSSYDPDTELAAVDVRLGELETIVDSISPINDVPGWIDVVESETAENVPYLDIDAVVEVVFARASSIGSPLVAEAVSAAAEAISEDVLERATVVYEREARKVHARALNRLTGPMSDINAVNSSAFAVGLALLESDFEGRVKEAQNDLMLPMNQAAFNAFINVYMDVVRNYLASYANARNTKVSYMMNASQQILSLTEAGYAHQQKLTDITADIKRTKVIAKTEENERNLDYDAREALWDGELFQYMGNMLSAGSGSVVPVQQGPSRTQTALSGALSGAALGAKTFPNNPVLGALGGGVAGALAGYNL
jgi:hypothetical protein